MNNEQGSIQDFIAVLLSVERHKRLDPNSLLVQLPIDPYQTVADIGCGPGFFSLPMAKYLSHGKLYALDIEEEMLTTLKERMLGSRLTNIEILRNKSENEFPINENTLDGILMAFVVHQAEDRIAVLKAATSLLKPRGWMGVLEWYRKNTDLGPPLKDRIDPSDMISLANTARLNMLRQRDLNRDQYMILFEKEGL